MFQRSKGHNLLRGSEEGCKANTGQLKEHVFAVNDKESQNMCNMIVISRTPSEAQV